MGKIKRGLMWWLLPSRKALGENEIRRGQDLIKALWRSARGADRPRIKDDTFDKACRRHGIDDQRLHEIIATYRLQCAVAWIAVLTCGLCWGLGAYYLSFNTMLMSALGMMLGGVMLLRSAFRLWQCRRRRLSNLTAWWSPRQTGIVGGLTLFFLIAPFLSFLVLPAKADSAAGLRIYIDAAEGDMSVRMLGAILGGIENILPGTATPLTVTFMTLNTAILAIGVFFVTYNLTAGLAQTAHEGEFLGKRFSSLWIPVRTVVGIGGLVPAFGGWSFAQIIMLWATLVGVGAANIAWQKGSEAMLAHVGGSVIRPDTEIANKTITGMLQSQLCMIGLNDGRGITEENWQDPEANPLGFEYLAPQGKAAGDGMGIYFGGSGNGDDAPDLCGAQLIILREKDLGQKIEGTPRQGTTRSLVQSALNHPEIDYKAVAQAHKDALLAMSGSLLPHSKDLYFNGTLPSQDTLLQIQQDYKHQVAQAVGVSLGAVESEFSNYLAAEGQSWVQAGGVFAKILSVNRDVQKTASIVPAYFPPEDIPPDDPFYSGVNGAKIKFEGLQKKQKRSSKDKQAAGAAGNRLDELGNKVYDSSAIRKTLDLLTSGNDDFLMGLTAAGHKIIYTSMGGVGGAFALAAAAETTVGASVLGTKTGGITGVITAALTWLLPVVLPLVVSGLTMGVWIPLVPVIQWFGGVVSWLVVVVEAVVAAPLWMLSHLNTEGEGMGPKTSHGYMFILNLLFRPILMIIGLLAGWLILNVGGELLKNLLSVAFTLGGFAFDGLIGLIMFAGILVVAAFVSVGLVNKCFSLIHVLPDQVLAWVGGHLRGMGGDDDTKAHTIIGAAGGYMRDGAKGSAAKVAKAQEQNKGTQGKTNSL